MVKHLLLSLIAVSAFGQAFTFRDVPWIGQQFPATSQIQDDMESYASGVTVNSLNGGTLWGGAYVDRTGDTGIAQQDDLESYSNAASLNSLNGGLWSGGAYVDRSDYLGTMEHDDFEAYSNGAVNGLNGGTSDAGSWGGAYVDR